MRALGYRHAVAHLLDGVELPRAVEDLKRDTRRYAKRQRTWLSSEPNLIHIVPEENGPPPAGIVKMYLS